MKMIRLLNMGVLCLLMLANISFAKEKTVTYQSPKAFSNLYYDFTGSSDPGYPKNKTNISQLLFASEMTKNAALSMQDGPLVMFINSTLYIYDSKGNRQLALLMRTAPDSGFLEMTALSHIGPALAYLAKTKEYGDERWRDNMKGLLKDIQAVRTVNAQKQNNWLDQVNAPVWAKHKTDIHNMVDYACSSAGNYISDVLAGKKSFTTASLQKDFFDSNDSFPIPYNDVMIATFMLTAYQSMTAIQAQLAKLTIDWPHAKVIIRFVAGSNVTAGVSAESNWLVPFVKSLSNNQLPDDRVYIAPYIDVKPSLGNAKLSSSDLNYYNYRFASTYNRTHIAQDVFTEIPDITRPQAQAGIPGDYGVSKATDINDFMMRLKYSLAQPTEMLSNTVGFWMAGELAAKKWNTDNVDIPGLTIGLPKGIETYPANNPEIPS